MAFIVSFARTAEEHTANITAGKMLGEMPQTISATPIGGFNEDNNRSSSIWRFRKKT
jgi:hypothetical protein